jgi:hypothetical protein
MEKTDHSRLVSDRASNYFVSGEDKIKPGSIPGDTISKRSQKYPKG